MFAVVLNLYYIIIPCCDICIYAWYTGAWKWVNVRAYELAWLGIGRLVVRDSSVAYALAILAIHSLSACHQLAPAGATDWFNIGRAMGCNGIKLVIYP